MVFQAKTQTKFFLLNQPPALRGQPLHPQLCLRIHARRDQPSAVGGLEGAEAEGGRGEEGLLLRRGRK